MSDNYVRLANHKNNPGDYEHAKELRQNAVVAERILWNELRPALKPLNLRLRRQHTISPYIVDLICLKLRLIIEIDGPSHDIRYAYDEQRTQYLNSLGYEVMRFSNAQVMSHCANVVETIYVRLAKLLSDVPRP